MTVTDEVLAPQSRPAPAQSPPRRLNKHLAGWIFVAPLAIGIAVFNVYPILFSLYTSFTSWNGFGVHSFIGVDNFTRMVHDDIFLKTLRNTIYYSAVTIPLTILVALLLALLCNTERLPIRGFFRTAYFTPFVTNVVAISLVWFQLYAPDTGVINRLLAIFGITGQSWLTDSAWAMPAVIVVATWHGVGYPMLILLSGLQGIPKGLYEAAAVDGASRWSRLIRITLPLLSPSLFFVIITQVIATFQVFGIIFVMTQGGPANGTNVFIYNLYQNGFVFGKFGYASALAWVLFIVIMIITLIQLKLQKRWVFYG
ncbi:carbohydrate ABC transporter permease [Microlunatus soli]|uniref:Multiple sugar transport system permease protein n=1 Tax=Microlunatus soli TaxID=630515 RepID=A0A1H1RUT2_9ACTN|nr:sugar ABC transporter permease [Microlunatus soli]SDS39393.1 multiple sugar transport system permease protein [Microlunatus soli]